MAYEVLISDHKPVLARADYVAAIEKPFTPHFEALRAGIVLRKIRQDGSWHQNAAEGVPAFTDGRVARFSMRAGGDLMASIWSAEDGHDYEYMDFS